MAKSTKVALEPVVTPVTASTGIQEISVKYTNGLVRETKRVDGNLTVQEAIYAIGLDTSIGIVHLNGSPVTPEQMGEKLSEAVDGSDAASISVVAKADNGKN